MKRHINCKTCNGHGYTITKRRMKFILRDCSICKGKGFVVVEIIDKRKNSADQGMNLVPAEI